MVIIIPAIINSIYYTNYIRQCTIGNITTVFNHEPRYDSTSYQTYPLEAQPSRLGIRASLHTIAMRADRACLAAIGAHNWEPERVEHAYQIIGIYKVPMGELMGQERL